MPKRRWLWADEHTAQRMSLKLVGVVALPICERQHRALGCVLVHVTETTMETSPLDIPDIYADLRNMALTMPPVNLLTASYGATPIYDDGPCAPTDWLDPQGIIRSECERPAQGRWTNSNDYSCMGYPFERLQRCVRKVAADLPLIMHRHEAQAVVVRGGSGVVFAGALLMVTDAIKVVVARKRGEQSHSVQIEACGGGSVMIRNYIVLDDFVSSGATVAGIMEDMGENARCAAIVEYRYAEHGQPPEENPLDAYHLQRIKGAGVRRYSYRCAGGTFY